MGEKHISTEGVEVLERRGSVLGPRWDHPINNSNTRWMGLVGEGLGDQIGFTRSMPG